MGFAWVETGTYVFRILLTKGCDLPPDPSVLCHDRFSLARELAFVRNGVFQHEELTNVELMGFVSDGEEVGYGHWEVCLSASPLLGLIGFDLDQFLPQWSHGAQVGQL